MRTEFLALAVSVSSLIHHTTGKQSLTFPSVCLSLLLWMMPPYSVLALWRCAYGIARNWTALAGVDRVVPPAVLHGGPLGPGLAKVVEVLVGCLLWKMAHPREEIPLRMGPAPSFQTWMVVLFLSGIANLVLSLWSRHARSRGDHTGVHAMVDSSRGRNLSKREHVKLAAWALVNALCEEITSRGLWMQEFQSRGRASVLSANLLQALSFGVWHFHGIPSGWMGVGLTFVYGLAMGFMKEYGGGLLLPVVAHTIADYFIFAVIARQGGFQ